MKIKSSVPHSVLSYSMHSYILIFMVSFCAVVLCETSLRAGTQGTSHTNLSDKAVNSCGPRALRAAMSLLGHSIDITRCAELAGTDPNGVTTLAGLQNATQVLEQSCKGMNLKPNELAFISRPAILHVSLPSAKDHFVVFTSSNKGFFELIDPAHGQQKNFYTADQLRLMWKGDCVVFTDNPFITSLKAGTYRARGIISVIVGIALGTFAAILMALGLLRYSGFSFDTITVSTRRSAAFVLGTIVFIPTVIMVMGMRVAGNDSPKAKGPQLILGATVLNIGDLEWGKNFMTSIWIGNEGSGTLKIDKKKVMTSCACLRATVSKSELKGRDKDQLRIRMGPQKKMGPFQYSVFVPSNDLQHGKVLTIQGQVTGSGGIVYPPRLYFGRVDGVEGASKKLLYILRRQDVKILNVTSDLPFVTCTFNKRNASTFEINVSMEELPKAGPFHGTINIVTNDPETEYAEIAVPLSGIFTPQTGNEFSVRLSN